jgi:cell fate regulator YaaT (PSP1 superfamily)
MIEVIGVRFKKVGKIYYFDPANLQINKDDYVIVETARGVEFGKVVQEKKQVEETDVVLPLKKVIRLATEKDKHIVLENKENAKEAYMTCEKKIKTHKLDMNLVDVEYTFDRNKVIFYFTADGRVDFRELVKDLASVFKTRIELRQIGVRDEAKLLGGIGPCGRMLCCSTFLGDFEPVSIKMAKDQNLSLNPTKISGLCGRLMCCLKYENDEYEQAKRELPDVGKKLTTPLGRGRVVGLNILERIIQVDIKELERVVEYTLDELIEAGALTTS